VLLLGMGEAAEAKRRLIVEAGGTPVAEPGAETRLAFVALEEGAEAMAMALRARGLLVNVVDRPDLCDFTVPAIVDRSPVVVAVGTGGASASLSKALKERLELLLPRGLGRLAEAIRAARDEAGATVAERRAFWAALLAPGGALDPLKEHGDPLAAIAAGPRAPAPSGVERLDLPADPEELTLRQLRLLQRADLVVAPAGLPAAVLALVRRDSARETRIPDPVPPGLTIVVRLAGAAPGD
jgi:uroporphyrin-III C-methyltransferase/precorrin-2 dehydrogenase/sirohydrochlorin ferrochelatase